MWSIVNILMLWQMRADLKSNPVRGKKSIGCGCELIASLHKLEEITTQDFGRIGEFIVIQNDTSLMHGNGDSSVVEQHVSSLKDKTTDTNSEYDKEKVQERFTKLFNGIVVLRVDGGSEVEMNEDNDRISNGSNVTCVAPNGGVALVRYRKLSENAGAITCISES
ncbi:unnamed protein product [Adineta ricciae]|uniref:Uncharacterized protein n=1 Tax=Adineta ricciae TaxID=249248 RepID=A0A815T245_ADIRI|nr:unnamed protein product [Adineta ricciae]